LGDTPGYAKAFDAISNDPAAFLAFRELVFYATPAGKVYGLCGLYLHRPSAFSLARTHLTQSSRSLVWLKSSYDVFEEHDTHELAARPEGLCSEIGGAAQ
jgi:hypothetical protein